MTSSLGQMQATFIILFGSFSPGFHKYAFVLSESFDRSALFRDNIEYKFIFWKKSTWQNHHKQNQKTKGNLFTAHITEG